MSESCDESSKKKITEETGTFESCKCDIIITSNSCCSCLRCVDFSCCVTTVFFSRSRECSEQKHNWMLKHFALLSSSLDFNVKWNMIWRFVIVIHLKFHCITNTHLHSPMHKHQMNTINFLFYFELINFMSSIWFCECISVDAAIGSFISRNWWQRHCWWNRCNRSPFKVEHRHGCTGQIGVCIARTTTTFGLKQTSVSVQIESIEIAVVSTSSVLRASSIFWQYTQCWRRWQHIAWHAIDANDFGRSQRRYKFKWNQFNRIATPFKCTNKCATHNQYNQKCTTSFQSWRRWRNIRWKQKFNAKCSRLIFHSFCQTIFHSLKFMKKIECFKSNRELETAIMCKMILVCCNKEDILNDWKITITFPLNSRLIIFTLCARQTMACQNCHIFD